jgi:HNH endonuclease
MNVDNPSNTDIDTRLAALTEPHSDPDCLYHAITLTADDDLRVEFGMHTEWVDYTDDKMRHEIRQSRLVYSDYVTAWQNIGLPYCIIHTHHELLLFLVGGGNALVERTLAEGMFPRLLAPHPVVNVGRFGYKSFGLFEPSAFQRAPTPKLRMQVLKRDDQRCRICGRRPDDNSDLELHVHHIRPWEKGGVTDPSNLITLCHTCHNGLHPHDDPKLFDYIKPDEGANAFIQDFRRRVLNYRKVGFFGTPPHAERPARKRRHRFGKRYPG